MLGGSVFVALIRFMVNIAGVILMFSQMSEPRFERKKMALYYGCFSMFMVIVSCTWYYINWENYVRLAPIILYTMFGVFAYYTSKDSIGLKIYKLALDFYLMAVFMVASLEISILFFHRSVWADIILRGMLICLLSFCIHKYIKESMQDFGNYMEKESDWFSVAVMIICILLGIGYILNPDLNKAKNANRIYEIFINFLLTGTLQLLIYHFYRHIGREKEYERENQLMQMNYRLLERQLEILEESVSSGRKIRHDARHHNAVIAEYARKGQNEDLLQYLKEYEQEMDLEIPELICSNTAVNHILSAYTRKAKSENIDVTLDVEIGKELNIPSIDLVAILANAYENAIYACMEVKKLQKEHECFIRLMLKKKKNKLIISCSNTCRPETELKDGRPKNEFTGGVGVSSIIGTARKYGGEYDFKNNSGVFVFRLIMNNEPGNRKEEHFGMEKK